MSLRIVNYLTRIGLPTNLKKEATLETVNLLIKHHTKTIPFENIDVLLGRTINLDIDSIQTKLVDNKRGGYCFEQNLLFSSVLKEFGFKLSHLAGRIRWNAKSRETPAPRTHLFLLVTINNQDYIVDCGGAPVLSAAMPFVLNTPFSTPHDVRRIEKVEIDNFTKYYTQVQLNDSVFKDSCEFTLEKINDIDVEIMNWFTNMSPNSHFLNRLVVALAADEGKRIFIANENFSIRAYTGEILETIPITNMEMLLQVLDNKFGLSFPKNTNFQWKF